jgi:hypothetical protein
VKIATREMKEKMASGYEVVPGDVLKLLVEDGLQQINN